MKTFNRGGGVRIKNGIAQFFLPSSSFLSWLCIIYLDLIKCIPGGFSQKNWVGVCGLLPKPLPYLEPKSVIFPTTRKSSFLQKIHTLYHNGHMLTFIHPFCS